MLAFEPPHFGPEATFGGCIASGFSGPRRAAMGSARDFVLGVRIVNGLGEDLRFGGQVMKNVAGYDLSRLLTGSFGTLGLIAEASAKVLPLPQEERTLRFALDEAAAIESMNKWAAKPLSLSASCYADGALYVRLSGATGRGLGVTEENRRGCRPGWRRVLAGDPGTDPSAIQRRARAVAILDQINDCTARPGPAIDRMERRTALDRGGSRSVDGFRRCAQGWRTRNPVPRRQQASRHPAILAGTARHPQEAEARLRSPWHPRSRPHPC